MVSTRVKFFHPFSDHYMLLRGLDNPHIILGNGTEKTVRAYKENDRLDVILRVPVLQKINRQGTRADTQFLACFGCKARHRPLGTPAAFYIADSDF